MAPGYAGPMRIPLLAAIILGLMLGAMVPAGKAPPPAQPAPAAERPLKTVLERSGNGHFAVMATVNGEPVRFIVDTGADIVALTKDDARRAHVPFDEAEFTAVGRSASGEAIGQEVHIDSVDVEGKRRDDVGGVVLDGLQVSLLGQNYLRRLDAVELSGDKMILR